MECVDDGVPDTPAPIRTLLPKLRQQRGKISGENLAYAARDHIPPDDRKTTISSSLVAKIETGKRQPTPPVMRALAAALDVDPNVFVEYALAEARRQLDERQVGLEQAQKALRAFELVRYLEGLRDPVTRDATAEAVPDAAFWEALDQMEVALARESQADQRQPARPQGSGSDNGSPPPQDGESNDERSA